jgi:hypothetical protein
MNFTELRLILITISYLQVLVSYLDSDSLDLESAVWSFPSVLSWFRFRFICKNRYATLDSDSLELLCNLHCNQLFEVFSNQLFDQLFGLHSCLVYFLLCNQLFEVFLVSYLDFDSDSYVRTDMLHLIPIHLNCCVIYTIISCLKFSVISCLISCLVYTAVWFISLLCNQLFEVFFYLIGHQLFEVFSHQMFRMISSFLLSMNDFQFSFIYECFYVILFVARIQLWWFEKEKSSLSLAIYLSILV